MEIKYESEREIIIDKYLPIISKPRRIVIDNHSTGYRKNREIADRNIEHKLLTSGIDDANYYDELMK